VVARLLLIFAYLCGRTKRGTRRLLLQKPIQADRRASGILQAFPQCPHFSKGDSRSVPVVVRPEFPGVGFHIDGEHEIPRHPWHCTLAPASPLDDINRIRLAETSW
jgi:hypothetical protein